MAESHRVQMKQFNGTDYDNIYPKCKNLMSPEIVIIPEEGDEVTATVTNNDTGETYEEIVNHDRTITFIVNKFGSYHISARSMAQSTLEKDVDIKICAQYKISMFPEADPILNNNSWEVIRKYSDAGKAESTWAVGDTKQIIINGNIGNGASYSNYKSWVYILGFNHNASREGNNRIHFGCFRSEQNYSESNSIALDDDKYNARVYSSGYFIMNSDNDNTGGWKDSEMRTILLDADASSPSSAMSDSFLKALPNDLKAVMKQCTKYTDNYGRGSAGASHITATQDWVWLLSEFETGGTRAYANTAESNYQKQYQYYKNGNSKIKYKQSSTESVARWWLRSPAEGSIPFCIYSDDQFSYSPSGYSYGLAPAFCV